MFCLMTWPQSPTTNWQCAVALLRRYDAAIQMTNNPDELNATLPEVNIFFESKNINRLYSI